jgi:hypothetical protein
VTSAILHVTAALTMESVDASCTRSRCRCGRLGDAQGATVPAIRNNKAGGPHGVHEKRTQLYPIVSSIFALRPRDSLQRLWQVPNERALKQMMRGKKDVCLTTADPLVLKFIWSCRELTQPRIAQASSIRTTVPKVESAQVQKREGEGR